MKMGTSRKQGLRVVDCICYHISALYVIPSLYAWPSISFSTVLIASEWCGCSLFALFVWVWLCVSLPPYIKTLECSLMVLYLYVRPAHSILRLKCSSEALCAARCVCMCVYAWVCSNGVETEAMLEHGGTGGRSCYKTCHFLSSSEQRPILPHFAVICRGLRAAQGRLWDAWSRIRRQIYVWLRTKLCMKYCF